MRKLISAKGANKLFYTLAAGFLKLEQKKQRLSKKHMNDTGYKDLRR
jgi:hypothetical protein